MKITPHDLGTFLVSSRSRRGQYHIVDIREATCSCKAFNIRGTCRHLQAVLLTQTDLAERLKERAPMTVALVA
jgi:uncharacterized Zn finger protein